MTYNVLDLFAGCGGLAYGFENNDSFNIKLANDYWEPAMETYKHNFKNVNFVLDDIKNIDHKYLNNFFSDGVDVIIGGPPCQGFSMCGTRSETDKRNSLFYEYARIVKETSPYIFLMENVKGLLSMENPEGQDVIEAIYEEFGDIGYDLNHKVVDSKFYGVPQSRERVIIIGVRNDLVDNYKYPDKAFKENFFTVGQALDGIPNDNSNKGELEYEYNPNNPYLNYINSSCKNIYNHKKARHGDAVINRMSYVPQGGNWKDIPEDFRVGGIHSNAYKRLDPSEPSVTIKHAFKSMIIHPYYDRCLTVREVARLQSFPDDFIFKGSKTSQYQQLANAVPPMLSKHFSSSILSFLLKNNIKSKDMVGGNISYAQ